MSVTLPGDGTTVATVNVGGAEQQIVQVSSLPAVALDATALAALANAATPATQPVSLAAPVAVTGAFFQATQPVSGTLFIDNMVAQGLTDTQLRAAPVPVSMSNTLALTDTQLRATAVPVSIATAPTTPVTGTFWQATQPISGTVIANTGLLQPLTDTQLRAAAVPVSVSDPVTNITASGTLSALNQSLPITLNGRANTTFQLTGAWVATVIFEASNNGTDWTTIYAYKAGDNLVSNTGVTTNDIYRCTTSGFLQVRATIASLGSGAVIVNITASANASGVFLNFPLPPGPSNIGSVSPAPALLTSYNVAGVIAINTVLQTFDFLQTRSASIQCVSMGTTGVVTPEWSNDNVTWVAATLFTVAGVGVSTITAAGVFVTPVFARYLRLRLSTATTAGTTTFSIQQFDTPIQDWLATQPVSGNVGITGTPTVNQGTANAAPWLANPLTSALSVEASSAKVATGNSAATIVNPSFTGVQLFINISAVSGTTPTLVVRVQVQDPVSAAWVDLPGASTATLTATGLTLLTIYPGITAVANAAINQPLPRNYRLAWVVSGSFTFSVGAQYNV